ncbi:hypothetical protein P154DRAFT_211223 [Amniculicola lignicola CBS 123094]|uniref:Uncharacterized protein n=1 Tax=Amniculicola lignicola CBS 123094 TaxID=1392246 RepID=A0A6A5WG38_9PLEO|nr:hypothetical protein P154DRAFT_211223 [Amniculicola lignicola CBS 123094]
MADRSQRTHDHNRNAYQSFRIGMHLAYDSQDDTDDPPDRLEFLKGLEPILDKELGEAQQLEQGVLKQQFLSKIEQLSSDLQKKEQECKALEDDKERLQNEHRAEMRKLEEETEKEKRSGSRSKVEELYQAQKKSPDKENPAALSNKVTELNTAHAQALTEQEQTLKDARDEALETQRTSLVTQHAAALAAKEAELNTAHAQAWAEQEQTLKDARDEALEAQRTSLVTQHAAALAAKEESLREEHTTALREREETLHEEYANSLKACEDTLREEYTTALREREETLCEEHTSALRELENTLREDHDDDMAELDGGHAFALNAKETSLVEEHAKALEHQKMSLDAAHTSALAARETVLEEERNKALGMQKTSLDTAHASALSTLRKALNADHEGALARQKDSLDSAHRAERHIDMWMFKSILLTVREDRNTMLNARDHIIANAIRRARAAMARRHADLAAANRQLARRVRELQHERRQKRASQDARNRQLAQRIYFQKKLRATRTQLRENKGMVFALSAYVNSIREAVKGAYSHLGLRETPDTVGVDESIGLMAQNGRLFISRLYRRHIEALSGRLGLRLGNWPIYEHDSQMHNRKLHGLLARWVDKVVVSSHARQNEIDRLTAENERLETRLSDLDASLSSIIGDFSRLVKHYQTMVSMVKHGNRLYNSALLRKAALNEMLEASADKIDKLEKLVERYRRMVETQGGVLQKFMKVTGGSI